MKQSLEYFWSQCSRRLRMTVVLPCPVRPATMASSPGKKPTSRLSSAFQPQVFPAPATRMRSINAATEDSLDPSMTPPVARLPPGAPDEGVYYKYLLK